MAGETDGEALRAYLSRMLDRAVAEEDVIALRSVQRAALASWARTNGVALRSAILRSREPFTLRALRGGADEGAGPAARRPVGPTPEASLVGRAAAVLGVGIDIEEIDSLPQADDHRAHPFFQDHFSDVEIAHCLRQDDVAASFCGTWAAKEAILKSGVSVGRLLDIAITRDAEGRPHHPGCQLSISHTPRTAVAVCLRFSTPPPSGEHLVPFPMQATMSAPARVGRPLAVAVTTGAAILVMATAFLVQHL